MENWKGFKVKVADYLSGDDLHTADEYEAMFKAVCRECNENGKYQIVERDGFFLVEAIPDPTKEEIEAQELAKAKEQRAEAVNQITIEVDGMVFDGDEVSQERMSRSIVALDDGETIIWVLHDNSIANVTKEQLKMALRLAGQKQTELWTKPYENVSA